MSSIHWKFLRRLEEDREYVLVATTGLRFPWLSPRRMWRFQEYTRGILAQLGRTEGCLGYSLRTRPLQGSSISIWQNVDSLRQFQHQNPHASAMEAFRSTTPRRFRYAQWKGSIRTLPHSWEEIDARLAAPGQSA